jgi:hypothetical protein
LFNVDERTIATAKVTPCSVMTAPSIVAMVSPLFRL